MRELGNNLAPHVDLCAGGVPCHPLSMAGERRGLQDWTGDGDIFFRGIDYIKCRFTAFALGNFPGFKPIGGDRTCTTTMGGSWRDGGSPPAIMWSMPWTTASPTTELGGMPLAYCSVLVSRGFASPRH